VPFLNPIPSPVADCSAATLEWPRFLELLAGYSHSPVGRSWAVNLRPSTDRGWLDREHALVAEMRRLLAQRASIPLSSLFDPTSLLDKSRIEGAALEAEEIRDVLSLADDISAWAALMATPPDALDGEIGALAALSAPLQASNLKPIVESLRGRMLPDGSLTDNASPNLARIRREIERQQRQIEQSLRQTLRRLAEGGGVQDELITIRGERFVIPIKVDAKRRVPGVVHGASSSGQTVYVEPLETIEQNNELVQLFEEEQAEIHRIFLAMTRQIGAQSAVIGAGAAILAVVESLVIRGRFADDFQCIRPRFVGEADGLELRLALARHPLLEQRLRNAGGSIVPISIHLTNSERQLMISGPNTGGKTVGLKTTGLLAILAQAGIPVPAEEAVLPLFHELLADIGDSQSIEQNLSTFSAHIVNLNRIAGIAGPDSLVLLDELGSATDPEEGAALAVAIAAHFLHSRAWSLISTHHTSLKVYAANTEGVINAAVGFNEQTLAPTYELRQGVPGASAGINIASRLGLNAEIIASARSLLKDFEYQMRETVRAVDDRAAQQKLSKDAERRIAKLRREFSEQFNSSVVAGHTGADRGDVNAQPHIVRHVSAGDTVKLKSLGKTAVVQRQVDDKIFEVAIGPMKMRVNRDDIAEVVRNPQIATLTPLQAARGRGVSISVAEPDENMNWELNVIGRNVEEATDELEKFLDRAFLAGLPRVRIIHGTGMGILRKALRAFLNRHPQVATVTEPPHNEGGQGATVAELKL
jgi:DNA mismatch repair protein MutS2